MTEYWLAAAIGAGSGAALLALFVRLRAKTLAMQGFIIFVAMMWIYFGAQLASGSMEAIIYEGLFALLVVGVAQFTMLKWLPSIGIVILCHGAYDAIAGPHTGVAHWYPPLCAGFDFVVGSGLLIILMNKRKSEKPPENRSPA